MSCPGGDTTEARCLHRLGESARFVTVYPRGTAPPGAGERRTWNAGGGVANYDCVSGFACSSNVDDVAYFTALLDALAARIAIDPDRIYFTGLSNGAAMTHRLACSLADRIAAVAAVGGAGQMDIAPGCAPARSVPLLQVHGTADPCWTYVETDAACLGSTGIKIGVEASLAQWATRNGCDTTTTSVTLPDAAADGTTTTRVAWNGCAAAVELLRIQVAVTPGPTLPVSAPGGGRPCPTRFRERADLGVLQGAPAHRVTLITGNHPRTTNVRLNDEELRRARNLDSS